MKNYEKCKKFIAILGDFDFDYDGESSFYITDVDTWNKESLILDEDYYNEDVYDEIEKLGFDCSHDAENYFTVKKRFDNVEDLQEFLAPLPWIKAIDDNERYVDPKEIKPFVEPARETMMDIVNSFNGKMIIDDVLDKFETGKRYYLYNDIRVNANSCFYYFCQKNNVPNRYFCKGSNDECREFLEKYKDKVILCFPTDKYRVTLHAFDDEETINYLKENSTDYQKLVSILKRPTKKKAASVAKVKKGKNIDNAIQPDLNQPQLKENQIIVDDFLGKVIQDNRNSSLTQLALMEMTKNTKKLSGKVKFYVSDADKETELQKEKGKVIFCLETSKEKGLFLVFNNLSDIDKMKEKSPSYQKLKELYSAQNEDELGDL